VSLATGGTIAVRVGHVARTPFGEDKTMNMTPPARRQALTAFTPFEQWISSFFEPENRAPSSGDAPLLPKADIAETEKELIVSLEIPGGEENDLKVQITGNQLVVAGERKQRTEEKDKHYHRVETRYGAFERRFELPPDVRTDPEAVKATSRKGIVEIRIAKVEQRAPAKIPVKAV
jgi:HSP20 family protein